MQVKNHLGFYTLTGLVIANMIGAGVFTTSGFAMGDLKSAWLVLLAWIVGGCIAMCGALSYGCLVRLIPESGGEYLYLSRNIHPLIGFIAGWISLLAGFTGAIAYAAMTFEAYLLPQELSRQIPENIIASVVILLATITHSSRLWFGALMQNIIVILKLVLILGFILFALYGYSSESPAQIVSGGIDNFSFYAFAVTVMWISFSYSGFNAAVYIAGEVKDAREVVPKVMFLGTVAVMLIYLSLNAVFVLVPNPETIAYQQDVAVLVAGVIAGEPFVAFVRFVIAIALVTSVSAMIMIGPRVYTKMADDGLMPAFLKFKGEVPANAIYAQALLAMVVVWLSDLRELLSYLGFTLSLSLVVTITSLFIATKKISKKPPLPGYPWAPIIFIFSTVMFAVFAAINQPIEMIACLITFISGVLVYLLIQPR